MQPLPAKYRQKVRPVLSVHGVKQVDRDMRELYQKFNFFAHDGRWAFSTIIITVLPICRLFSYSGDSLWF